jgi:hypothetical protein
LFLRALHTLFPPLDLTAPAFTLAGVAGGVGDADGAAMAPIVMIVELTLEYTVIIPLTLTVSISYAVRRSVSKDSIYTRKPSLWGERVPESLRADLQFTQRGARIMDSHQKILSDATDLRDLPRDTNSVFVVTYGTGAVGGMVTGQSLAIVQRAKPTAAIGELL